MSNGPALHVAKEVPQEVRVRILALMFTSCVVRNKSVTLTGLVSLSTNRVLTSSGSGESSVRVRHEVPWVALTVMCPELPEDLSLTGPSPVRPG